MGQWFTVDNGFSHRHRSPGVQTHNTDIGRDAPRWHLLARENFNNLFFTARGIFGGEAGHFDRCARFGHRGLHASDGLWFVVFNADQNSAGAENVGQDCGAFNELIGETLHQSIVGSDVRLAFSAID